MKKVLALAAGILLAAANLYAGNGDLIVNGNLGVGTGIPGAKLSVVGGSTENYGLRVTSGGTNQGLYLGMFADTSYIYTNAKFSSAWTSDDATKPSWGLEWGAGTDMVKFRRAAAGSTSFSDFLVINNSGNVGIGTTNPSQGKLQIQQPTTDYALYIENTFGTSPSTAAKGLFVRTAGNDGDDIILNLQGYNTDVMRVLGNGNVGIGTTTPDPGYRLTVVGGGYTTEGTWESSDIKLKKNILPVEGALDKVLKLNGVSYEWKHGKDFEGETLEALKTDEDGKIKDDKYRDLPEGRTLGVIAQELEQVLPEAVNTGEDGIKAVSYTKIIPVLIEAMKEQQKQITAQLEEIKAQQMRIEELDKRVSLLK